jgi:hypothetical protein
MEAVWGAKGLRSKVAADGSPTLALSTPPDTRHAQCSVRAAEYDTAALPTFSVHHQQDLSLSSSSYLRFSYSTGGVVSGVV